MVKTALPMQGGTGSIPGQGTKSPYMCCHTKKSEKRHEMSSLERANQGGTHMLQRNLFFKKKKKKIYF